MDEQRPAIPTDLRRQILVETGHRCAIPTCRSIHVDIHHIIPWEQCKNHEYVNLIALCPNCHRMAEKDEIDRKSLRMYKNNLRFLYDKFTIFEIDVLFELYKIPVDHMIQIPPFMELLLKRIVEANLVEYQRTPVGVSIGGMKSNPDYLRITPQGKEFVKDLSQENVGY